MTDDIIELAPEHVRQLVRTQFPCWGDLSLTALESAGVDNAMFRLGSDLVVRLPRKASAVVSLLKEQEWLPRLGAHLPLKHPELVAVGAASDFYPWSWSVMSWIEGIPIRDQDVSDWRDISGPLTEFLAALHVAPTVGGPAPGRHNFGRGVPLALRDMATRDAIGRIGDLIDARTALAAWEHDARQPEWQAPPRWIHGDLHAHNLLARAGRLCAVIDFGGLGVGDPACDLAVAWRLLPAGARSTFKGAMQTDESSWLRGRAWALSISVIELNYYRGAAPGLNAIAKRTVAEVLTDFAQS